MDRGVAVALTAVVGGMVALQGPINSGLGKAIGNQQAAFFSFATGTVVLAVIAGLAKGGFGQIAEVKTLAPQYLIGGLLGACYVSCVLITWGFYTRRGGLLYDVERRPPAAPMPPTVAVRPA